MMTLAQIGGIAGAALVAFGAAGGFAATPTRRVLDRFPRHRAAAVALTLFNTLWVAYMVYHAPLGRFEGIKPFIIVLAPLTFVLAIRFMDELLAPRMWGGFLLLMAAPALDAARWHESPWRLVLTVLVYVWIVWGMILMLSPYRFRHTVEWVFDTALRIPVCGLLLAWGSLLLVLSLSAY